MAPFSYSPDRSDPQDQRRQRKRQHMRQPEPPLDRLDGDGDVTVQPGIPLEHHNRAASAALQTPFQRQDFCCEGGEQPREHSQNASSQEEPQQFRSSRRGTASSSMSNGGSSHSDDFAVKADSNPNHINMKQWIKVALHSLEENAEAQADEVASTNVKSKILSSGPYLDCALKIAHALADQLCRAEEQERDATYLSATGVGEASHSHLLKWPELVTIVLNGGGTTGDKDSDDTNGDAVEQLVSAILDHGPPPNVDDYDFLTSEDAPESEAQVEEKGGDPFEGRFIPIHDNNRSGIEAPQCARGDRKEDGKKESTTSFCDSIRSPPGSMGGSFCSDHEIFTGLSQDDWDHNRDAAEMHVRCYLNVSSAKLEIDGQRKHGTVLKKDQMMRMYYLGRVFFYLFSGGRKPFAQETLGIDPLADQLDGEGAYPTNLANAMTIIDAIGDDDELFGGAPSSGIDETTFSADLDGGGKRGCISNSTEEMQSHKNMRVVEASPFSVEPLKELGLPIALCGLIGNMVDCSRGDFSGDEAYSCVEDVKNDLKLMMGSPDVYLRDLDLDALCKAGLQMDDRAATWYGRDTEFASLKQAYLRSLSNMCEAAIICGQPGIGKSKLAHEFVQYACAGDKENDAKGCIFLEGKFDKTQPFSPIASAFNNYCEWLLSSPNRSFMVQQITSELKLSLGQEAYTLAGVIPSLAKILGGTADVDQNDNPQVRLRYLFCQFADVISRSHDAPLVLFLDNLQYADHASIDIIKQILLMRGNNSQFFFLGCFSEIMGNENTVWAMLDSVADFGVSRTKIELDCFDKETVNLMISKKLSMLPRLTRPLTDIVHHKTKGNPFFVRQLLIELSKEGLMRPSLIKCRWIWDEEKIQERELPDDVVLFLTSSLTRLPSEVLSALCTLSCFGTCSDRSLIELETELDLSLSAALDHAVEEGFLNKNSEQYSFVDSRVREATYNLMKPDERCLQHNGIGMALCAVASRKEDDGLQLIAVGQINLGGPKAVSGEEEGLLVANYNLKAAKIAMAMSDFFSAYWFCDYGISYLKSGHWQNQYELSLELFNLGAECALIVGEESSVTLLTSQVLQYGKCIEDKLSIFHITLRFLIRRSNLPAAIECGIDALSKLGEDFPESATNDVVMHFLEDTEEMLEGLSDDDIVIHKMMTDSNKIMAMKLLSKLAEPLLMLRPSHQPIVVMKMVQLTIQEGLSPVCPMAFVAYGSFIASRGNIRDGYRYAKVAKSLLSKIDSRQVAGEVIAYATALTSYVEPVQSAIELHIDGRAAAMAGGATVYAMLNALLFDVGSFWSGKKLGLVKSQLDQTVRELKQYKVMICLVQLMPLYGSVTKMIGLPSHGLSNSETNDTETMQRNLRAQNPFQSKPHYFNKMYTAFMFRDYDGMKAAIEMYSKFKIGSYVFVFSSSIQTLYEGLVAFRIARKEKNNAKWITKGKECLAAIEKLVETAGEWNFSNKAQLLKAEEQFCEGNIDLAETLYDEAIWSAKLHRFVNEEALANDLAGLFHLETGRAAEAEVCFEHAIDKYREWEAFGMATYLQQVMDAI